MYKSLKNAVLKGVCWSFLEQFSKLGISFVLGILMARLLSPREFGLVGVLIAFVAFFSIIIDGGFSQSLIRKKSCNEIDYSTIFYFNIIVAVLLYLLLFFSAHLVADFFEQPQFVSLLKVLSIVLIFDSLSIIPKTKLIRDVNFKLQTKIAILSNSLGGTVGVCMACLGFEVWSLVGQQIVQKGLNAFLFCLWVRWKPKLVFSKTVFKDHFSFGFKLLISGLISTVYRNIYLLVIGKYYSVTELGYYSKADQFKALPSQNIQSVIQRVTYPVLSGIQDNSLLLKSSYIKLVRCSVFISFILMLCMAAVAESLIVALIGVLWLPAVPYLQLLCLVGMLYPLHALNLNILKVLGRSDLFLKLEIIKNILVIPTVILGIVFGIRIMIISLFFTSVIAFFLNSYWSGKLIGYSYLQQLRDIVPSLLLAISISSVIYIVGEVLILGMWWKLFVQLGLGLFMIIGICEFIRFEDYLYLKNILFSLYEDRLSSENTEDSYN